MAISAKQVMELRQKTGVGMMECKKALEETDGDFDAAIKLLREKGQAKASKRAGREANEGRVEIKVNDGNTAGAMVMVNSETDFVARNQEFIELTESLADEALANCDKADGAVLPLDAFDAARITELSGKIGEKLTLSGAACLTTETGFVDSYVHPGNQVGVLLLLEGDRDALKSDAARTLSHDLTMQIAAAAPDYVRRDEVPETVVEKEKEIYKTQMRNEGKPENILDKIATGKMNKFFEETCLEEQPYVKEPKVKVSDRIAEAAKEAGGELRVARFVRFKIGEGAEDGE